MRPWLRSAWQQNSDGGFHFVHVLSTFAATAKSVDLEIGRIDFDRRGIGDLRNNIDAGERSVPAFVRVERRNPNEAMDAALGLKIAVGIFAAHQQRDRFDSDFFAGLNIDNLRFETAPLDPALIHAQKHVGPVARFGAAGAGVNCYERVRAIAFAGEKLAQLELFELVHETIVFR